MLLAEHPTWRGRVRLAASMVSVGAYKTWERIGEQPAKYFRDVPSSPSKFSAEWLSGVLCKSVVGARVESYEFGRTSSGATDRQALTIQYNDAGRRAGLPPALFCKYSNSFNQRLWLGNSELMQHEVKFYQFVRPELDIETPRSYHAAYHPLGWQSVVMLEDLKVTKEVSFCTPTTPMTREMMEDILGELAKFHGRYWNDPRLDQEFVWLKTPLQLFRRFCETFSFKSQVLAGLICADHVVSNKLKGHNDELWQAYGRSCAQSNALPRSLIHGDPHVGNTYITGNGKMGIGDWQVVMKGSWAWDVAYLILTALPIEDRRNWEHHLLTYYLDRLKSNGGNPGTFDAAWLEYRRHALHAFMGWLVTIGASGVQPKGQQVDDTSLAVIERAATAMVDLESIESLA